MSMVEMDALDDGLCEVTCDVVEQLTGHAPTVSPTALGPLAGFGARVRIEATRPVFLVIVMATDVARQMASAVFGLSADAVGPEECRDVVAEVANILVGSVKGLFGDRAAQSLPEPYDVVATAAPPEGAHARWFALDGAPLVVWWEPVG